MEAYAVKNPEPIFFNAEQNPRRRHRRNPWTMEKVPGVGYAGVGTGASLTSGRKAPKWAGRRFRRSPRGWSQAKLLAFGGAVDGSGTATATKVKRTYGKRRGRKMSRKRGGRKRGLPKGLRLWMSKQKRLGRGGRRLKGPRTRVKRIGGVNSYVTTISRRRRGPHAGITIFRNPESFLIPRYGDFKSQGAVKSILIGAGGLIATNLVGMALDAAVDEIGKKYDMGANAEYIKDGTRIFGKIALGSLMSYGVSKVTKNPSQARIFQTGVYISAGLDIAGTIVKYVTRKMGETKSGLRMGAVNIPMTMGNIAIGALGLGSFQKYWVENQIRDSIYKTGRVDVGGDESGKVGLLHAVTGQVILAGNEKQMAPVIGSISGIMGQIRQDDRELDQGIGEDISIEA